MTFIKAFFNGEIRRIGLDNVSSFRDLEHELQDLFQVEGTPLKIQYKDDDGDEVVMSSDKELQAAIASLSNGLLRLHLSASSGSTGFVDKPRSASVAEKSPSDPEPPKPTQQKLIFGRGKAGAKAQPHDTFSRKQNAGVTPLKLNLSSPAQGPASPVTPQPTSAKGKNPGLGLKLDLKAVKGDYEATPVPNINLGPDQGSDSDTEDLTDDNTEDTDGGSDEEGGEAEGAEEEAKERTKKAPPGRSFSAFLGFRNKNTKGLKQRDPGTIRIINHAPAPQLPCRVHSGLGDEFGIAPGTYWTFLLCETSTALELLKQIKEKLGCELVHIALFARNNSNPPKDTRIADDQLIFPLKESWQKKNLDMKFAVKERPFGESVKDAGGNDELKRMQYKLQVTAQAPQGGAPPNGNISGRSAGAKSDVLSASGENFTLSGAAIKKPNKKFV